jgi:hypothetical protein
MRWGLALVVVACCKRENAATVATPVTSVVTPAVPSASVALAPRAVKDQSCAIAPAVTVSEGRGGYGQSISASKAGVIVSWLEQRPLPGPDGFKELVEFARPFDVSPAAALAPKSVAKEIGSQGAPDAFANGIATYATDAELGTASCNWAAFAGNLDCSIGPIGARSAENFHEREPGPGPQKDAIAVTRVGDKFVLLLPSCRDIRAYASGLKAPRFIATTSDTDRAACGDESVDRVGIATVGNHALAIWRRSAAIEARELDETGKTVGGIIKISAPGTFSGKPTVLGGSSDAIVAFASRAKPSETWRLVFARWKSGSAVTRETVDTGTQPAMAPSLVPTSDPACVLMSWTEGTGKTTSAHAAHVCSDQVVAASKVDISAAGVEAGDSALAPATDGAYTAWQELPANAPAVLQLSRITCK